MPVGALSAVGVVSAVGVALAAHRVSMASRDLAVDLGLFLISSTQAGLDGGVGPVEPFAGPGHRRPGQVDDLLAPVDLLLIGVGP